MIETGGGKKEDLFAWEAIGNLLGESKRRVFRQGGKIAKNKRSFLTQSGGKGFQRPFCIRGGADDDRRMAGQIDILIEKSPEKRAIPIARKVRNEAGRIVPRKKRHALNLELNEQQARLVANDG